jgi:hypothetical protein
MATNMPKPKSTRKPNVKVLPKRNSGSIGKLTNMAAKPTPTPKPKPGLNFMNPDEALRRKRQREIDNATKGGTGSMNSKQYDAYLKKVIADMNKKK